MQHAQHQMHEHINNVFKHKTIPPKNHGDMKRTCRLTEKRTFVYERQQILAHWIDAELNVLQN